MTSYNVKIPCICSGKTQVFCIVKLKVQAHTNSLNIIQNDHDYMYACMRVCMYVCMYVYLYICINIQYISYKYLCVCVCEIEAP